MAGLSDLKIIAHMLFSPGRGADHAGRLEAFYSGQATGYDQFRKRFLHGRERLMHLLPLKPGMRWLDMGGGTGQNLEAVTAMVPGLASVEVVDLSPSLLQQAAARVQQHGWSNVTTVNADVTTYEPQDGLADVVTFSYSLTMIPDWFRAIDHARQLLKPGGVIGVVDFYVSRKWPATGRQRHSGPARAFWPAWFGYDNVFPSPDHLPYLHYRFTPITVEEHRGRNPYLLGVRVPYYVFLGRKEA